MTAPRAHLISTVTKDYVDRLVATDSATKPQLMLCIPVSVPDAATGDIDIVMANKFEVVRVDCLKRAGAGAANTMQLKNGADAITNAIACDTDNTLTTASTIDDAFSVLDVGDELTITATRAAGTRTAQVFIYGFLRA